MLKAREIKRIYELQGPRQAVTYLTEALRKRECRPEDFSIRDLAEGLVSDGSEWVRMMDPRSAGGVNVLEAGEGVDVTAFLNVSSQIIYSMLDHDQPIWAVAVPITLRYEGDAQPGLCVRGYSFAE